MTQFRQDSYNDFGKALAEFIMKCESGSGSGNGSVGGETDGEIQQTPLPKNFGPFYILAGAYPQDLVVG